jgi:hypothetical protein
MNHDQDTVLVELTINDQGDVQLRLVNPPSDLHSSQERAPTLHFLSEEAKNWLKSAKPVKLDLPPDPSTISICNLPPS